jgi:hypothetical protein
MNIELLAVIATIVSAIIGAIAGYFIARYQNKQLAKTKKDEIAQALTEIEIERMERLGISSQYSSLAHWLVIRELIEKYRGNNSRLGIEQIRDDFEAQYKNFCQKLREETNQLEDSHQSPAAIPITHSKTTEIPTTGSSNPTYQKRAKKIKR